MEPEDRAGDPGAPLVRDRRRHPERVGRERPLVQRAERPALPAAAPEPEGAGRLAHPGAVLGPVPAHRAAVGRGGRGVGRAQGAPAEDRDGLRPDGRPHRLHAPAVAARPQLPARGAARDPPDRPAPAERALRQPLHRQRRADRAAPARPRRARAPFGRRLARDFRRATGFALPDPAARARARSPRRACAGSLVALLGRPLLRDEGGAGPPHPPARPGRGRQPQRLRLHRRLHPLGLHPPGRLRRRRRGRSLRELPGARPRRAGPLQPRLRGQAAVRPHRAGARGSSSRASTTRATSRCPATCGPGAPRRCAPGPPTSASSRRTTRASPTGACTGRCSTSRAACAGRGAVAAHRPRAARPLRDRQRGPGQPDRAGNLRYRTDGDAIYTTYSLLGELAGGAFSFDADTRLGAQPARLAAARTLWLPAADTLDARFADQLAAWVQGPAAR